MSPSQIDSQPQPEPESAPRFTPGPWGPMNDGPDLQRAPWTPWQAGLEAAPGLTIASPENTEPICRVSGCLQPVVANAQLIAVAPDLYEVAELVVARYGFDPVDEFCLCCGTIPCFSRCPAGKARAALAKVREGAGS